MWIHPFQIEPLLSCPLSRNTQPTPLCVAGIHVRGQPKTRPSTMSSGSYTQNLQPRGLAHDDALPPQKSYGVLGTAEWEPGGRGDASTFLFTQLLSSESETGRRLSLVGKSTPRRTRQPPEVACVSDDLKH